MDTRPITCQSHDTPGTQAAVAKRSRQLGNGAVTKPGISELEQEQEQDALSLEIAQLRRLLAQFDVQRHDMGSPHPDMALHSHLLPDAP